MPAVTTAQMREIDRVAIDEIGLNLYQMMENAGRNLAELCAEFLGAGWGEAHIVVVTGSGGNGGGGICAARHLANHGGAVTLLTTRQERLRGVPADQFALYQATSGRLVELDEAGHLKPDLVVDAVLGYSLDGAPRGTAAEAIRWIDAQDAPVISLDVPSGIDSTTGEAAGDHVHATVTMTLALPKTGLNTDAVGRLAVADIGIPHEVFTRVGVDPPSSLFAEGYRVWLDAGAVPTKAGERR
ncbi:MAG: NAD(P)H-hydrate epimerase [Rhodoglobus sp.]|nr:NAD(P)H-hydrate epimerase [Rhodoglobus sp.]